MRSRTAKTGDLFRSDASLSEAMHVAEDVVKWRVGPNAPGWRIARLAQALVDQELADEQRQRRAAVS